MTRVIWGVLLFSTVLLTAAEKCEPQTGLSQLGDISKKLTETYCGQIKELKQNGTTMQYLVTANGKQFITLSPEDGATTNKLKIAINQHMCFEGKLQNSCELPIVSASKMKPFKGKLCGVVKSSKGSDEFELVSDWGGKSILMAEDGATMNKFNSLKNKTICVKGRSTDEGISVRSAAHITPYSGTMCGTVKKYAGYYTISVAGTSTKLTGKGLSSYVGKDACVSPNTWTAGTTNIPTSSQVNEHRGVKCGVVKKVNKNLMMGQNTLQPEDGSSGHILSNAKTKPVCVDANWSDNPVSVVSPSKIYKTK